MYFSINLTKRDRHISVCLRSIARAPVLRLKIPARVNHNSSGPETVGSHMCCCAAQHRRGHRSSCRNALLFSLNFFFSVRKPSSAMQDAPSSLSMLALRSFETLSMHHCKKSLMTVQFLMRASHDRFCFVGLIGRVRRVQISARAKSFRREQHIGLARRIRR